ncbi:MAG: hypothetical protein LBD55_08675 [Treponema sp.]|jgi:hypothetical protein|nr:hypothetical protein [Treponema sp.]
MDVIRIITMMKKYTVCRILGILLLYAGVLALLGMIQFSGKGIFTKQVGGLLITGHYRSQEYPNQYILNGDLSVSFGGMEFSIADAENGFSLVRPDGKKERILPESMLVSDDKVTLEIPGGTELVFAAHYVEEKPALTISAVLGEHTAGLELPYKPLKAAKIQEGADGQFMLVVDGLRYRFGKESINSERPVLTLHPVELSISYHAVPEKQEPAFNPKEFIIPTGYDKQAYDRVITRWRDQSFPLWGKNMAGSNNEDLVVAYAGEAVSRRYYSTAVSSVPAAFLNGNRRTYESSVFLGRLDQGLRSLAASEQDKMNRLSQLINERSLEFLKEPHVFEYLAIRGYLNVIDEAAKAVQSMDPNTLSPGIIAGILEGSSDWIRYRAIMEKTSAPENPFGRYIAPAYLIISQSLKKAAGGDRVFVFFDTADTELNLRLGKALMIYAENSGNTDWAAIGRSLITSVISLVNELGTAPAMLRISPEGNISEDAAVPHLSSARLYRILNPEENYPRAVSISTAPNHIWAWTAASAVEVSRENNILDISITFPVGETHYMLIRGISQPSRLQLYEIDYRTAPDFERYNSSGWSYSASEQTLLIKMRHRSLVEQVKIFN